MDIRKPKGIHSLREFGLELITIVIGISIALGAEALVEGHRIDEAVDFSRADFVEELTHNREEAMADLAQSRQVERQMAAIINEGAAVLAGKPVTSANHRMERDFPSLRSAAWSGALSTQVMGHFPHIEGRAVARAYSAQQDFANLERAEQDVWYRLAEEAFVGKETKADLISSVRHIMVGYTYLKGHEESEAALVKAYDEALSKLHSAT